MSCDTDIVIQGGLWEETYDVACEYSELEFVNDVIISTWHSELEKISGYSRHPNIRWVINPFPENPGPPYSNGRPGNINLALLSSKFGVQATTSSVVVKVRSDMHIYPDSMYTLNKFFNKFSGIPNVEYTNSSGPLSSIFSLGVIPPWPYCPHDQVFWGYREDLVDLFDLPLVAVDHEMAVGVSVFRPEVYIGGYYYARFDSSIYEHLNEPKTYLIDGAPKFNEAISLSEKFGHEIFKPFPKIAMNWIKYNSGFWYDEYEAQGAVYYNDVWE